MSKILHSLLYLAGGFMACLIFLAQAQAAPSRPFPQHVIYAAGTIKPNHRTQAQLDNDVRAFYQHWKASYLVQQGVTAAGQPLYRVTVGSTNPGRTVSEGQGYGMIIVALMAGYDPNAQAIFDGLWRFSRKHPSIIDARLMDWEWYAGDNRDDSAFDGDADIAYGLLLARRQWGSSGQINYGSAAKQVITAILQSTIGPDSRLPMLGDWTEPNGSQYNQYTPRSSDFMPSHFRAFRRFTANPAWGQVVSNSQTVINAIQANYSPTTGLLPDFIVMSHPAPPNFLEDPHDGHFYYNAGRTPWRLGMDVLLYNNAVSRTQVRKMSKWIQGAAQGSPAKIKAGYKLNGVPIGNYFTSFFVTPFGVAAMCDSTQQAWLNAIYSKVYNDHEDYYEDSVTLLGLLVMTGNYWDPTK